MEKFQPVDKIHYGGPGFHYIIGYRKFTEVDYTTVRIEAPTNTYEITSPGVDVPYTFYVQSYNDKGPGPDPKVYRAMSGRESKFFVRHFSL